MIETFSISFLSFVFLGVLVMCDCVYVLHQHYINSLNQPRRQQLLVCGYW